MAFSSLIEDIETGQGKFDLKRNYYVNNSTEDDIVVSWASNQPEERGSGTYLIKSGEVGGPYPQFLAYHIVKKLVNREMQRDGKIAYFASALHRKPYEEKFLQEVEQPSPLANQETRYSSEEVSSVPAPLQVQEHPKQRGRPRKQVKEFEGANRT